MLGGAIAAAAAAADVKAGVVGRGGEDEELLEGGANGVEVGVAAGPGDGGGAGSGDVLPLNIMLVTLRATLGTALKRCFEELSCSPIDKNTP